MTADRVWGLILGAAASFILALFGLRQLAKALEHTLFET